MGRSLSGAGFTWPAAGRRVRVCRIQRVINHRSKGEYMNKTLLIVAILGLSGVAFGQVGSTVTQGAQATAEKAKEVGDRAKGAVASEPNKSVDKAKASVHKAKAHSHAKAAKEAAKEIPK